MADEYEREFMAGSGEILHRQKATIPKWAIGIAAGMPAGLSVAAAGVLGILGLISLLPALAIVGGAALYAAFIGMIMILTGVARLSVSEGEFHMQMGTKDLRIPIKDIESVELAPSPSRNVGMGVRRLMNGTRVYNMFGSPKQAVHIKQAGKSDIVFVCREPQALFDAVKEAQARSGAKVRVQTSEGEAEELEVAAKSEDEFGRMR